MPGKTVRVADNGTSEALAKRCLSRVNPPRVISGQKKNLTADGADVRG
jgi:hypothetical protein